MPLLRRIAMLFGLAGSSAVSSGAYGQQAEMHPVNVRLFADANDFQLLDSIAVGVNLRDEFERNEPQTLVYEMWGGDGLLGNGGFSSLFRSDIEPEAFARMHDRIGAKHSAAIIRKAMTVFPNAKPPQDPFDRADAVDEFADEQFEFLDARSDEYWRDEPNRRRKLADFVRANETAFRGLEVGWVAENYVKNLKPTPGADADVRTVADWIRGLEGSASLSSDSTAIIDIDLPRHRRDTEATLKRLLGMPTIRNSIEALGFDSLAVDLKAVRPLLEQFPKLRRLTFSNAPVKDEDVGVLTGLPITLLDVRRTQVTDAGVARMAEMKTLRHVVLSQLPDLTSKSIERLAELPELEEVDLPDHLITNANMVHLAKLQGLTTIFFVDRPLSKAGLEHVSRLPNLQSLGLRSAQLTDEDLTPLARITHLKSLSLYGNEKVTDAGTASLRPLKQLEALELGGTLVGDETLQWVRTLTGLKRLGLDDTSVTSAGVQRLETLRALEQLSLIRTAINDETMSAIATFSSLKKLSLNDTNVTDKGFARLQGMRDLVNLSFPGTRVTDQSLDVLLSLPRLRSAYTDRFSEQVESRLDEYLERPN